MTTIYLAVSFTIDIPCLLEMDRVVRERYGEPSVLISYAYMEDFTKILGKIPVEKWMMDSGAFTAWSAGKSLNVERYLEFCKLIRASSTPPAEIVCPDVIYSPLESFNNYMLCRSHVEDIIPVWHIGDPEEHLLEYCRLAKKVAIGGMSQFRGKELLRFVERCFALTWPKKLHGFACTSTKVLDPFPWHSVDSSSWALQPRSFGMYKDFKKVDHLSYRNQRLTGQVLYFMEKQAQLRHRFRRQLQQLETE